MKYRHETLERMVVERIGVVTIDGPVQVESVAFLIRGGVLEKYNGQAVDVVVPEAVVDIAIDAFNGCRIRSIQFPATIRNLTAKMPETIQKVYLPLGLEVIGNQVFSGCEILENVEFPASLRTIGGRAFYGCNSLTRVIIPETTRFSNWQAFWNCGNLIDVRATSLQQFLNTPWGDSRYKDLTGYLHSVLEQRKQKRACPFCGGKMRWHITGHYECCVCDFGSSFGNGVNGYYADVASIYDEGVSEDVGAILGGDYNARDHRRIAHSWYAKLIADYLATKGMQWK